MAVKRKARQKGEKTSEFHVYMPALLAQQVRALAKEDLRPLNSQIIVLIQEGLKGRTLPA